MDDKRGGTKKDSLSIPLVVFLVFFLLIIGIAGAGVAFYLNQKSHIESDERQDLNAIALLKVTQIKNWLSEVIDNGRAIQESRWIMDGLRLFLAKPADPKKGDSIRQWLESIKEIYGYQNALFADATGHVLLSALPKAASIDTEELDLIAAARCSGRPMLSELHRSLGSPEIHQDMVIPVPGSPPGPGAEAGAVSGDSGVVLLRIDPYRFLYPLIQSWPRASESAETLLVKREGNEVVFLNELRHRKNTALTLRFPADKTDLPAAQAVRGISGVMAGSDYRGIPVLAALRPIRGTSWFMVAKIDLREIHGPLRRAGVVIFAVCLLFILSAGLVVIVWWLRQSRRTMHKEHEAKLEQRALNELLVIKQSEVEALEFAENTINTVREPLIVLDQDLKIIKVNSSFYDIFKVKPEETIGRNIYDLGNKQWDIPKLRELLQTILPQNITFNNYEVEHDFATIGRRTMLLNARQIQKAIGKEKIILLAIEDITERRRAEEVIRAHTLELESTNRDLDAFSYSVSHDLRAPLRAIDGFSRIVLEEYASTLDPEARRLLDVIRNNTRRMGQLIDDLLDFSRLGRTEIHLSRIDMASMARSVFEELLPPGETGKTEFRVGSLPDAFGDPTLVRAVWANLLSNAIKFSGNKERRAVEVGGKTAGDENVYFVRDNGAGFDMRYINKLFGVFQRLHSLEEFEGTGVGLAIIQRIIQRLGGRVWAEGRVGAGAMFSFSLPRPNADDMEEKHG